LKISRAGRTWSAPAFPPIEIAEKFAPIEVDADLVEKRFYFQQGARRRSPGPAPAPPPPFAHFSFYSYVLDEKLV